MNNQWRKELDKAFDMLEEAKSIIEIIKDEEQDSYDNMPESLQNGEKGEKAQESINNLEEAINVLYTAMGNVETAKE
jgi:hypothetical protein